QDSVPLRAGLNAIEVEVTNPQGPPALWLTLTADGARIASDATWEGSLMGAPPAPVRLTERPSSESLELGAAERASNLSPWSAARKLLPLLLLFALATDLLLLGARAVERRRTGRRGSSPWGALLFAVALVLVACLLWNNRSLDASWGFDSGGHTDYVN